MRRAAAWSLCVALLQPEPGSGWLTSAPSAAAGLQATGGRRQQQHQRRQQQSRQLTAPASRRTRVVLSARQSHGHRRQSWTLAPSSNLPTHPRSSNNNSNKNTIINSNSNSNGGGSNSQLYHRKSGGSSSSSSSSGKRGGSALNAATRVAAGAAGAPSISGIRRRSPAKKVVQETSSKAAAAAGVAAGAAAAAASAAVSAARSKKGGVGGGVAGSAQNGWAKPAEPWGARLTLALVACLYGTNYTAIKYMGDFLDTSSLLTLRFGLAGLTLLPALQGVGRDVLLAGAEVGVYATMGYMAQAYAMRSLPASQLALVGCLAVLVVPLLDHLSGRRRAGVSTIGAAVLACGGAAVLQAGGIESGASDDAGLLPHVLALLQPLFFGMSTWRMEAHVARHPGQALPLTAAQVAVVAATSALWGVVSGGFPSAVPEALAHPGTDPWALAVLVWLGLVNTAVVLFLETEALESVSASEATVIYSLEPLVGAGMAASVLGEPFGPGTALGASLVLGGCLCSSLGSGGGDGGGGGGGGAAGGGGVACKS